MDLKAFLDIDSRRFRNGLRDASRALEQNQRDMETYGRQANRVQDRLDELALRAVDTERKKNEKLKKQELAFRKDSIAISRSLKEAQTKVREEQDALQERQLKRRQIIQDQIDKSEKKRIDTIRKAGEIEAAAVIAAEEKISAAREAASKKRIALERSFNDTSSSINRRRGNVNVQYDALVAGAQEKFGAGENRRNRFVQIQAQRQRALDKLTSEVSGTEATSPLVLRQIADAKKLAEQTFDQFSKIEQSRLTRFISGINRRRERILDALTGDITRAEQTKNLNIATLTSEQKSTEAKIETRLDRLRGRLRAAVDRTIDEVDVNIQTLTSRKEKEIPVTQKLRNLFNKLRTLRDRETELIVSNTRTVEGINTEFERASANTNRNQTRLERLREALRKNQEAAQKNIEDNIGATERLRLNDDRRDIRDRSLASAYGVYHGVRNALSFTRDGANDNLFAQRELNSTNIDPKEYTRFLSILSKQSQKTGIDLKDMASSFREVENVLGSGAKGIDTWETSIKASVATGSDLVSTARTLATVLSLFPTEIATATQGANVLIQASRDSRLQFEDFSKVLGATVGFGKDMGVTLAEQAAALALFTNAGFDAATAGTQLRNVFQRTGTPAKETIKYLQQLENESGVQVVKAFTRASVRGEGFTNTLVLLAEAAKKTKRDVSDVFSTTFPNLRGTAGAVILGKSVSNPNGDDGKSFIELSKKYDKARYDSTVIEQQYRAALASTATQFAITEQATKKASQELSVALLPTIRTVTNAVTLLSKVVGDGSNPIVQFTANLTAFGVTAFGVGNGVRATVAAFTLLTPQGRIAAGVIGLVGVAMAALGASTNKTTEELVNQDKKLRDSQEAKKSRIVFLLAKLSELQKAEKQTVDVQNQQLTVTKELQLIAPDVLSRIYNATTAYRLQKTTIDELNRAQMEYSELQRSRAVYDIESKLRGLGVEKRKYQTDALTPLAKGKFDNVVEKARQSAIGRGLLGSAGENTTTALVNFLSGVAGGAELIALMQEYGVPFDTIFKGTYKQALYDAIKAREKDVNQRIAFETSELGFAKAKIKAPVVGNPKPNSNPSGGGGGSVPQKQFDDEVDKLYARYQNLNEKIYLLTHGDTELSRSKFLSFQRSNGFYNLDKKEYKSKAEADADVKLLQAAIERLGKLVDEKEFQRDKHKKMIEAIDRLKNFMVNLNVESSDNTERLQKFLTDVFRIDGLEYNNKSLLPTDDIEKALDKTKSIDDANALFKKWEAANKEGEKSLKKFFSDRKKQADKLKAEQKKFDAQQSKGLAEAKKAREKQDKEQIESFMDFLQSLKKEKLRREELALQIQGEFESVGESDINAFIRSDRRDPNKITKDLREFYEKQFATVEATKKLQDTLSKLKSLQRRKGETTGNPIIDRITADIREKDTRNQYVQSIETPFRSAVSNGISAGLKSRKASDSLRAFGESMRDSVIDALSDQGAKFAFDQLKNTGIFGNLFGDLNYSKETQSAINGPEAFVAALRTTVLNVNVVGGIGGVPGVPGTPSTPGIPGAPSIPGVPSPNNKGADYGAILGKVGIVLAANNLLGNPLGRAGRYLSNQLFGKKDKNKPNESRSQGVNIVMNGVNMTQPTDAVAVSNEVTRKMQVLGA
jgi:TP901 family phage tail tape measure protein